MTEIRGQRRAYAAIIVKGRILLVRNRAGRWTLPGGRAHEGESLRDAAQREVLEEVGLVVKLGSRVSGRHVRVHESGCEACVIFTARVKRGKPRPRAEIRELAWVALDEAPARMGAFNRRRVRKALDRVS